MKIISMIDSFKGTMTSIELNNITKKVLEKKGNIVKEIAISDGGEGFLDTFENIIECKREYVTVKDPLFRSIDTYYLVDKNTAYIELAKSSGLNLLLKSELNPFKTSTYGFGQLIKDAINKGYKRIVLGIGGSSTNDGGSGMLEALGCVFYNSVQQIVNMCNEKLAQVVAIETNKFNNYIKDVEFVVLSDVNNPLLGPTGATYVFSKQKGAKEEDFNLLEENLKHLSLYKFDYVNNLGSGAAGGVGYAVQAYLNAKVYSGITYILDLIDFDNLIKDYDAIISGEGKIDKQSLYGKVIYNVIQRSKEKKIILLSAICELDKKELNSNIDIYSIVGEKVSKEESLANPKYYFEEMVRKVVI